MKNFFILVIILIILFVIFKCSKNVIENFNDNPKILIMVISNSRNNISKNLNLRWSSEKDTWLKYFKPKNNIKLELLECKADIQENFVQNYQCKESYRPGIFQKTILSLKSNIDDYDYFVRTNLSTFIIQSRLQSYLKNIKTDDLYDGVYCNHKKNWIAGWGVILNKKTSKLLIKNGLKNDNFNKNAPDDVIIGDIMESNGIQCNTKKRKHLGHSWNYNLSDKENIKNIENNPNAIFIRLTNRGIEKDPNKQKEYLNASRKLYKVYG